MVLNFLLLLYNYDNLTLTFHQKSYYLNEGWFFIGRLKAGSLTRVINKEVSAQIIYKPIQSIQIVYHENLLP